MYKQALPLAAFLALAACDGNTQNPVVGRATPEPAPLPDDTVNEAGIPTELALNVDNVSFDEGDPADPSDDTLTISGLPQDSLDSTDGVAVYERQESLDVPGFEAYSSQINPESRVYVAVSAESADGTVRAVSVADGGQFNTFYRGNHYEAVVPWTSASENGPTGQVQYSGFYAGVTNLDDRSQSIRLETTTSDPAATPFQPRQTQGVVALNVDFTDNSVEGSITDRQFTDGKPLDDLALVPGEDLGNLDPETGEYTGNVEFLGRTDLGPQGTYGGAIGGDTASSTAGVVQLTNLFSDATDQDDSAFDNEVGSFVLSRCDTPDAPSTC